MNSRNQAEQITENYYDSSDADVFYERVWGGEDIHVGLYQPGLSIYAASRNTVATMAAQLSSINTQSKVLDLGAGYGGAARYLAKRFGSQVTCLNLSNIQNQRNQQLSREQGLQSHITVVHGSFEAIPEQQAVYDIVWSQDAFLHSAHKRKVLQEITRVLKPGGELIFTDPMQSDDCPDGVLQPVYDRLHLNSLGSMRFYRENLAALGFEEVSLSPYTAQLRTHYFEVGEKLKREYSQLKQSISQNYLDKMIRGLQHWVDAADNHFLAWGILHFRKL